MKSFRFLAFFPAILAGCASQYQVPQSAAAAEIRISSTPVEGTTSQVIRLFAIPVGSCAQNTDGEIISKEFELGSPKNLSTKFEKVAADRPFSFIVKYIDSKYALNRECAVQANFVPLAGHKYGGTLIVKDNVAACNFSLDDITNGQTNPVAFEMPAQICPFEGKLARPNGQAIRTRLQIQTVPQ